jgi:hypothetical protein
MAADFPKWFGEEKRGFVFRITTLRFLADKRFMTVRMIRVWRFAGWLKYQMDYDFGNG